MLLPIHPFRDRILGSLKDAGRLILSAPTGSGKSTGVPRFLLEDRSAFPGKVLVLEPRRLAARSLAARVAAEAGVRLGGEVGYQVRFESRCGPGTAVVFQTYGVFLQRLLSDPWLDGVGTVLLDEFHERTLETDLSLAWLKSAREARRPDIRFAVMSATLDAAGLAGYLPGAARVDVPGSPFPVEIRHLPVGGPGRLPDGALEALRSLAREGLDGSALVFMPGMREIRRTVGALGGFCREHGLELLELHGSMELSLQQKVLEPGASRRVIVSTNVAETSLTVPGVSVVVDSGWHRLAGYSPGRDLNTLSLARISRQNAVQRAGRAGRTGPGRCVRLWSKAEECSMAEAVAPEIRRLELSPMLLKAACLPGRLDWLSEPEEKALASAGKTLRALRALDEDGSLTAEGRALLRYPLPPRLASVLERARGLGRDVYERACAMAAVLESPLDRRPGSSADLFEVSAQVLSGETESLPWETFEVFRQLRRLGEGLEPGAAAREDLLAGLWLEAYGDRLAARQEEGPAYRMADGRCVLLREEKSRSPRLTLALDLQETGGAGQARQLGAAVHLPCEPRDILKLHPGECRWEESSAYDPRRGRMSRERRLMFRGVAIDRSEAGQDRASRKEDAGCLAQMLAEGRLALPSRDEKVEQLVTRIRLARRLYPDYGFPEMGETDWRLIFEEVCEGRGSLEEIGRVRLEPAIGRYVGPGPMGFLDKALPARLKLRSGRFGRLTYSEDKPAQTSEVRRTGPSQTNGLPKFGTAELSARLGDLVGMGGTLSLCEGRLPVVFDILAPNLRTVQKTADLGSFWKNVYPSIKKELKRKYPKHPWP